MLSGEIISKKAKRVLYPVFFIFLFNFILFLIRWQVTKDSGATVGVVEGDGYRIVEHGHTLYVTSAEYWLSRMQLVSLAVCFMAVLATRIHFYRTGDLKKTTSI